MHPSFNLLIIRLNNLIIYKEKLKGLLLFPVSKNQIYNPNKYVVYLSI
jgi:hypothetical protein